MTLNRNDATPKLHGWIHGQLTYENLAGHVYERAWVWHQPRIWIYMAICMSPRYYASVMTNDSNVNPNVRTRDYIYLNLKFLFILFTVFDLSWPRLYMHETFLIE